MCIRDRAVGTLALLFVVPAFFIVFQKLHEKYQGTKVQEISEVKADDAIVAAPKVVEAAAKEEERPIVEDVIETIEDEAQITEEEKTTEE